VRPDGREVYVQRGWLRASHRKLDRRASTVTRPVQTHLHADAKPLTPGVPTPMRLEVFPFAHMFRKGSAIRISIEAPTGLTGLWGFGFNQNPATNTVHADAEHPSRLVLKVIPKLNAPIALPACDTVRSQPCRSGTAPVPPGTERPPLPSRRRRWSACHGRIARIVLPNSARRTRLTIRVDGRVTKRVRRRGRLLHVRLTDARVAHRIVVRFRVNRRWKTRDYLVAPCRR
jgi:X-Pro dipeptidyl-peptidase C-terminal non-catalytic domain